MKLDMICFSDLISYLLSDRKGKKSGIPFYSTLSLKLAFLKTEP